MKQLRPRSGTGVTGLELIQKVVGGQCFDTLASVLIISLYISYYVSAFSGVVSRFSRIFLLELILGDHSLVRRRTPLWSERPKGGMVQIELQS